MNKSESNRIDTKNSRNLNLKPNILKSAKKLNTNSSENNKISQNKNQSQRIIRFDQNLNNLTNTSKNNNFKRGGTSSTDNLFLKSFFICIHYLYTIITISVYICLI